MITIAAMVDELDDRIAEMRAERPLLLDQWATYRDLLTARRRLQRVALRNEPTDYDEGTLP